MERKTLYRFFEGETTLNEEKQIREWMEKSEINFHHFMQIRKEYDILMLSSSKTLFKEKRTPFSPWLAGIAAAVVLILIISGVYLFGTKEYIPQYNTIIVPPGQRINLTLSDDTELWLNANTQFRYPSDFAENNRTVYLDGEAYFEVSKDSKRPFIVKTVQGDVRVTGTSFNLEAYSKYGSFETSLFEGGIDIYKNERILTSLKPSQKASLKEGNLLIEKIADYDEFLWKDGLIAFNNASLEDILHSLEKYFDVEIEINSARLPQRTYSGKFRQSDGIDYALRVLQKSIRFSYERNEESGKIQIK